MHDILDHRIARARLLRRFNPFRGKAIRHHISRILCPGAKCSALRDGRPIYIDTNHLNYCGHVLLYPGLRAALAGKGEGR